MFLKMIGFMLLNIPSHNVNIDTSVNAVFVSNKLNAAKNYVDITDCLV
jgi:hypothetical protein